MDFNLQFSALQASLYIRTVFLPPGAVFLIIFHESLRICVYKPATMRRLLLLLLGVLILHQSCCFEFVIDGEWEEDVVS